LALVCDAFRGVHSKRAVAALLRRRRFFKKDLLICF
jgi:hypothetical protein